MSMNISQARRSEASREMTRSAKRLVVMFLAFLALCVGCSAGVASGQSHDSAAPVGASEPVVSLSADVRGSDLIQGVLAIDASEGVRFNSMSDDRTARIDFYVRNLTGRPVNIRSLHVVDSPLFTQTAAEPTRPVEIEPHGFARFWMEFDVHECDKPAVFDAPIEYEVRGPSGDWLQSHLGPPIVMAGGWMQSLISGLCK